MNNPLDIINRSPTSGINKVLNFRLGLYYSEEYDAVIEFSERLDG